MKIKLLIVDDDEMILKALRLELEERYAVVVTREAREVPALARRERPDAILCDIEMPGMDGGDVSAALFADEALRDIPLLFLTGLASPADLTNTRGQLGGRPAVSKSVPIDELIARIEALLQR